MTDISRDKTTGEVLLSVLIKEKPTENVKNAAPTFEDYDLSVFGEESGKGEA